MRNDVTLIPLSPFLAMIAETGELIPAFAGGMGGNDPAPIPETPVVPEASPEEKALYAKQAEAADLQMQLARDNKARNDAILPELYKSYGLQMVKNPDGTYSATEAPKTPEQLQSQQITNAANARTLAALKGELPVDPAVEADMNRQKTTQDTELARRGVRAGSGDIYTRARTELDRSQNVTRDAIRTGQMTTADAISRGRTADTLASSGQKLQAVGTGAGVTGQAAGMVGNASSLYGNAANPYRDVRLTEGNNIANTRRANKDYEWQSSLQEAQGANSLIGGGMSGAATIGSAMLLACWIAEVLYGRWNPQTHTLRLWLNTLGERSVLIALGMVVYRRYGRAAAGWLARHTWAQPPVRWLFNRLYRRAVGDLKGVHAWAN
jgi:hypothetical protein